MIFNMSPTIRRNTFRILNYDFKFSLMFNQLTPPQTFTSGRLSHQQLSMLVYGYFLSFQLLFSRFTYMSHSGCVFFGWISGDDFDLGRPGEMMQRFPGLRRMIYKQVIRLARFSNREP